MDRKPPASTDAPALDGEDDGHSLAAILEDAERRASAKSVTEQMADEIAALYPVAKPDETCLLFFDNPVEQVSDWIRNGARRELGFRPAWVRIAKTNLGRGGIFTVSNPTADGEAELIAILQRNVLTRRVLAEVASWAFQILGLTRLVVRIPADRADLSAMALKAGFRHEGTARRYFHNAVDAQIWAMCSAECKWLPKLPPLIPPDVSPPFSHRMH